MTTLFDTPSKRFEKLASKRLAKATWNEGDHPRDNDGKFTEGGGGGHTKPVEPTSDRATRYAANTLAALNGALIGYRVHPSIFGALAGASLLTLGNNAAIQALRPIMSPDKYGNKKQ